MKALLKLLAVLVLALALLLTLFAAWVTWFFDLDDYREDIGALIARETGLEIEIAGPIEHHLLQGFNLAVSGVTARYNGRSVAAIERLEARIFLFGLLNRELVLKRLALKVTELDAERDNQGVLNLLPALTGDRPTRSPPVSAAAAWVERVRIDGLEVEIGRGRYLDSAEGLELKLDGLALRIEPIPILWRTEMVLDDPSLLMAFSEAGELRARAVDLGGIHLEELDIAFANDHGNIDFQRLALRLTHGKAGKPGYIRLDAKGKTTLRLAFDEPLEQLSETRWGAIDDIELQGLELEIGELELISREGRLSLKESRLEAGSLPLLLEGRPLVQLVAELPAEVPLRIGVHGAMLMADATRLEDYALALEKRKGKLELVVEKGRLRIDPKRPQGQIKRLSARLDGEARFRIKPRSAGSASPVESVRLEAAALQVDELELGMDDRRLQLKNTRLQVRALPLPLGDRPLAALLVAEPSFKLMARGASLVTIAARLEDYDLSLGNEKEGVAVVLDKGRLRVEPGAMDPKIKRLSLQLAGKARLRVKAGSGDRPLDSIVADSLSMGAKQGVIDTAVGSYRFAGATLEGVMLPLLLQGEAVEWGDLERLARATRGSKLTVKGEGLEHEDLTVDSLVLGLASREDTLHLESLDVRLANTTLKGSGEIRVRGDTSPWRLQLTTERVGLSPLTLFFNSGFRARGDIAVDLDLHGAGIDRMKLGRKLQGRVAISGRDIEIYGIDLDRVLSDLERTQDAGLLGLGAYALAGPAGTLLIQKGHYNALLESSSRQGTSRVEALHSELRFEAGVLHTEDAAFATPKHRLAVKGSIDLKENGPLSLQIATLDPNGCARYMEEIKGTAEKPEVAKAGVVIKGVITPVTSILGTVGGLLARGGCAEPFYTGKVAASVADPESGK